MVENDASIDGLIKEGRMNERRFNNNNVAYVMRQLKRSNKMNVKYNHHLIRSLQSNLSTII
jgi:hypothetical protein